MAVSRYLLLATITCTLAFAQMKMTVAQLRSFIQSSIQLKHDDGKVAAYLKKMQLTEKLDDRAVEEMIGLGAGARTINALRELRDASDKLPAAPKPEVKVVAPPPPPIPPPSQKEQDEILEKVTQYALEYDKRLPDFICAQVTRRYYDPTGLEFWSNSDTITAKLTYFQNKEEKKVIMVNNTYKDIDYEKLGGAISTGEFGSLLREVFEPHSHAQFTWSRWTTLRSKRNYVFAYRVSRAYSKWGLYYERSMEDKPGYQGEIFVDRETLQVMRVTMQATDITPSFPIQMASNKLDYDYEDLSGQKFLLPLRSEMRMRSGKMLIKNEVEFRMYRKFGADANITFDTNLDALPPDKLEEKPATSNKP